MSSDSQPTARRPSRIGLGNSPSAIIAYIDERDSLSRSSRSLRLNICGSIEYTFHKLLHLVEGYGAFWL